MASSEDYKKLYELYQVEGVPKGISIVDFCQINGIVYKHFVSHQNIVGINDMI